MKPTVRWESAYGGPTLVRIVQKPIPGLGKFVIRWRRKDASLSSYLSSKGLTWSDCQKSAYVFPTWKDAEWFCDSVEGWDKELPGPAIVKLVPKYTWGDLSFFLFTVPCHA